MSVQTILSLPVGSMEALTAFNRPVFEAHAELHALLKQRLGDRFASVLSRPVQQGDQIAWTTDVPGTVLSWSQLPPADQARFTGTRVQYGEALARLSVELARSGPNTHDGNLAQILNAALEVPGIEHLHWVDDQPVLTFWGFRRARAGRFEPFFPEPLAPPSPVMPVDSLPRPAVLPWWRRWWWLFLLLLLLLLVVGGWSWRDRLQALELPHITWPFTRPIEVEPPPPVAVSPPTPSEPPPILTPVPDAGGTPQGSGDAKPPGLSEEGWNKHDLGMLEGCWLLGEPYPVTRYNKTTGKPIEDGEAQAGRICFDKSGHGTEYADVNYKSGKISCQINLRGKFNSSGEFEADSTGSECNNGETWDEYSILCRQNGQDSAECQVKSGSEDRGIEKFRRADSR